MYQMFDGCYDLTSLNLTSFDTSNVTIMQFMFNNCSSLTSLDLSKFSFEKTPNVSYMLIGVGYIAENKPIHVKVSADGYTYLTQTTTNCGISPMAAKFVKPDDTDWGD